jgi:hypothetical protein
MPEHLSTDPIERGEQLAAQGMPDVQALPGAPSAPKGKKGAKDPAADPAKPAPLAEDAPKGETSRGEKATEVVEAEQRAKGDKGKADQEAEAHAQKPAPEPAGHAKDQTQTQDKRGEDPGRVTTRDLKHPTGKR